MNPPLEKEVIHNAPLDFELRDLDQRHPYLLQRGFAPSTINHFGLGFCRKGYLKDRAAIPLHDLTGKLIGYAGRLTTEHAVSADKPKYLFPGERSRNGVTLSFRKSEFLYNAHRLTPRLSRLLIVEGFTSVWWLHQLGIREVVAVMGSSIAAEQVMLIANHMADNGIVSVLFDGDEAGRNGAVSAVTDLASVVPVRLCHLGDGQQPTDLSADDLHEVIGW
ncbi:MAG TPA: toprim domain-containing protein [Methylomirabilota bacterium]|nr:toprim domain-containing protein [Methylomirabilota bacterium]